jgi:hypothetical protein
VRILLEFAANQGNAEMLARLILPIALLAVFAPVAGHAIGTDFVGSVTAELTVVLKAPLTSTQTVYCELDLAGSDKGDETFKAHNLITATKVTATKYSCDVLVPYNWDNQDYTSDTMTITATYEAAVFDTTQPVTVPGAAFSSGTFPAASAETTGGAIKYKTTVDLY